METPQDPEQELKHTTDEFEERLGQLDDDIGDAQKLADEQVDRAGGTEGPADDEAARANDGHPGDPQSKHGMGEETLSGSDDDSDN